MPLFPRPLRSTALLLLAAPLLPALMAVAGEIRIAALPPAAATVDALVAGPSVRVLLGEDGRWELGGDPLILRSSDGRLLRELAPGDGLLLEAAGSGVQVVVRTAAGERLQLPPQLAGVWLEPLARAASQASFRLGKERYRGRLQIRPLASGSLQAINVLPLEIYLASVVGSEMPAAWPQAALQAQAVAARTYALSQLKPAAPFDLKATVESQAYRGLASETDSTRAAVAATRGEVLMASGRLIQAVFHSSSGGSTEDSGQVWSRQLPYLVSVPDFDEGSPVSRWRLRLEPEQLRRLFREIDGVRRIEVLAKSSSGRIRRARVIGPAGSVELSGGELRQRLGLRSTLVTFQLQPVALPAVATAVDRAVRWPPGAAGTPQPPPGGAPVVDSASGAVLLPASAPPPLPGPAANGAADPAGPVAAALAPLTAPQWYALVVEGRGFGHGVGMSQWGAFAMARQGRSYEQILRHYYRGVELVPYPAP